MTRSQAELLLAIEGYLGRTGMGPRAFGRRAVNDGNLLRRLRTGRITVDTYDALWAFMRAHPDGVFGRAEPPPAAEPVPSGAAPRRRRRGRSAPPSAADEAA
jgi:hypothetical protein